MKRNALIIICYALMAVLTIGLLLAFSLPLLYWKGLTPINLNVWIVDKTVPNIDYREHKGLIWLLNSKKVTYEKTGSVFRYDADYYGFFPVDKDQFTIKEMPDSIENPDLIYLADTYGVYEDDYFSTNIEGTRSELIYGGLNENELVSIKANLGGGNTIIGEFNIASSPTNMASRDQLHQIFRVSWCGWSGRYFRDLTNGIEVPVWTAQNYENQSGEKWSFSGEGFVLVSDEDEVIVLQKGTHIGESDLYLSFKDEYVDEFGINGDIPYDYWFEFTNPNASAEVLATYTLDLTDQGKTVFNELGLPATFPAIIRSANTQYTSYYFAGDFADRDATDKWWNYYGFAKYKRIFTFGTKGDNSNFFWKCYVPMMEKIIKDIRLRTVSSEKIIDKTQEVQYLAKTTKSGFMVMQNSQWEDFYARGVNIGSSIPGKWFTEFSDDESMYLEWFEMIAEMKANCIRIYTLLSPQFYNALEYYNRSHPDDVLWLYQEIWPEEHPEDQDYLKEDYDKAFAKEIENVIDAMHGQANIPQRKGRAYGIYTSDVSPYIVGYLVGRELEPEEVISTNERNKGYLYAGEYLYCEDHASPTEAWLAMSCDYVLTYEAERYNWQHPVGIVSWPTLDPKEHDSEWNQSGDKSLEYNDKVSIDINHILAKDILKAGFFGAYHIYPNYPDFMNNEQSYAEYMDEEGIFRYGGYLKEFMEGHKNYPALIAEFGLATGMGNAHESPDGYHHGGLTEKHQGEGIVRMMKAMDKEGYAGGLIFEWADEWAKKTWTTEPYMIPYERNPIWHNAVDPEQNYGILAMESNETKSSPYSIDGEGLIRNMSLYADETYLHLDIELKRELDFSKESLIFGLDTYGRSKGEFKYYPDISMYAPTGLEFLIELNSKTEGQILVHPGYNAANGRYTSYISFNGIFEKMTSLINKERVTADGTKINSVYQDLSKLNYGILEKNSYNHWTVNGTKVSIRIPWTRINFADPSNMRVLDDQRVILSPLTDELQTVISDGILVSGLLLSKEDKEIMATVGLLNRNALKWDNWDVPSYEKRLKDSYLIIRDYFESLDPQK